MPWWHLIGALLCVRSSSGFLSPYSQRQARVIRLPRQLSQSGREASPAPAAAEVPLVQLDQALVEAARRELQASDAEWYQAVILGEAPDIVDPAIDAIPESPREPVTPVPRPPDYDPVLRELGYSEEEAAAIPDDMAGIIVESRIPRPPQGLPREWLVDWREVEDSRVVEDDEEEEVEVVVEKRRRGKRRPAAVEEAVQPVPYYDEEEDEYLYDEDYDDEGYGGRGRKGPPPPPSPLAVGDDFPPTFTETEPGFFPLFVRSLSHAVQEVPFFQPLLKEEKFKDMLSREADFRVAVAGPWLADWLRDEYRWRLGVFRDYLRLDGTNNPKRLPPEQKRKGGWRWEAADDDAAPAEEEEEDDVVAERRRRPLSSSSRGDGWRPGGSAYGPTAGSRRGATASGRRRRAAADKPEWSEFEEKENLNEKSSTWSWVNSDVAPRGGGGERGRSRGSRMMGTVVRGRYEEEEEDDDDEDEIW